MYEYPFGNGQQLNLDWFLNEWKNLLAAWEAEKNGIEGALQAEIDRAEAALADVIAARDAAAQSATAAGNSADAAAQSATDASGYLATVRADANTASNAARNASQSESNAAESAQTALASKNTAANSERNAAQSEANANSSKNAAAQSASDANASKSAAAQSAADANASKRAAAQSAEDAENAAGSVESSAQQIETNTTDINNLKNLTNYSIGKDQVKQFLSNNNVPSFQGDASITIKDNIIKVAGGSNNAQYAYIGIQKESSKIVNAATSSIPNYVTIDDFTEIPLWIKNKPSSYNYSLALVASAINPTLWKPLNTPQLKFTIYGAIVSNNELSAITPLIDLNLNPNDTNNSPYELSKITIMRMGYNIFEGFTHFCSMLLTTGRGAENEQAMAINLTLTDESILATLASTILEH